MPEKLPTPHTVSYSMSSTNDRAMTFCVEPPLPHVGEGFMYGVLGHTDRKVVDLEHIATSVDGTFFTAVLGDMIAVERVPLVRKVLQKRLATVATSPQVALDMSRQIPFDAHSELISGRRPQ